MALYFRTIRTPLKNFRLEINYNSISVSVLGLLSPGSWWRCCFSAETRWAIASHSKIFSNHRFISYGPFICQWSRWYWDCWGDGFRRCWASERNPRSMHFWFFNAFSQRFDSVYSIAQIFRFLNVENAGRSPDPNVDISSSMPTSAWLTEKQVRLDGGVFYLLFFSQIIWSSITNNVSIYYFGGVHLSRKFVMPSTQT